MTCILSGSAKEVYETGSQTADLFLMLNSMLSNSSLSLQYKQVLHTACYVTFPDLALEMGLCTAACDVVDSMMENPDREDQVCFFTVPTAYFFSLDSSLLSFP